MREMGIEEARKVLGTLAMPGEPDVALTRNGVRVATLSPEPAAGNRPWYLSDRVMRASVERLESGEPFDTTSAAARDQITGFRDALSRLGVADVPETVLWLTVTRAESGRLVAAACTPDGVREFELGTPAT